MQAFIDIVTNAYYIQVITMMGVYLIAALGLNLITGVTGQFSFGHAAYMSIGAYTSALLTMNLHLPFLLSLLAGGLMAALFGIVLAVPSMRLTGDYLGITTLGFGEIVRVVFVNMEITGGARGLAGIPRHTDLTVVFILVVLFIWALYRINNSRFGRALAAVREDEIAAESMGINTFLYKVESFAIGTFLAGISGGLYAHLLQYINPADFGFAKSFDLLNFVVIGGLGSIPGTVLGTTVLSLAPEFLRFVKEYRMLIYGGLMVLMMIFRPHGILGGVDLGRLFRKIADRKKPPAALSGGS